MVNSLSLILYIYVLFTSTCHPRTYRVSETSLLSEKVQLCIKASLWPRVKSHLSVSYLYIQSATLWILPLWVGLLRTFLGRGMVLGWNTLLQVWFGCSSYSDEVHQKTKQMRELIERGSKRWREGSHWQGRSALLSCCEQKVEIQNFYRGYCLFVGVL